MRQIDYKKLEELRELAYIPPNGGEQFIHPDLNLIWGDAGTIRFGFKWKREMGELNFTSLDQAIEIVKDLRKRANCENTNITNI